MVGYKEDPRILEIFETGKPYITQHMNAKERNEYVQFRKGKFDNRKQGPPNQIPQGPMSQHMGLMGPMGMIPPPFGQIPPPHQMNYGQPPPMGLGGRPPMNNYGMPFNPMQ
jgi:hypothetical protein